MKWTYINTAFANATKEALMKDLNKARIAFAQLSTVGDLSKHKFLRNLSVNYAGADVELADLPVRIDTARLTDVPTLGQHQADICAEFDK